MGNNGHSKHLRSVAIETEGSEVRIEQLASQEHEIAKIRISYWYQDRLRSGPLEISENELVTLLQKAIRAGILTPGFVNNLHSDVEI